MKYTCKKVGYTTRKIARKNLKRLQKLGREVKTIYKCEICECFHLTSQPQKKSRIRAKKSNNSFNKYDGDS